MDCCAVVADEQSSSVEGAEVVADMGEGSVGIHDNVGIVGGPNEEFHEEPLWPAVVASQVVQEFQSGNSCSQLYVPATRVKVRVPGGRKFMQNCV